MVKDQATVGQGKTSELYIPYDARCTWSACSLVSIITNVLIRVIFFSKCCRGTLDSLRCCRDGLLNDLSQLGGQQSLNDKGVFSSQWKVSIKLH